MNNDAREIPVLPSATVIDFVKNTDPVREYRVLSDEEKEVVFSIRSFGGAFIALLYGIGGTDATPERMASRELSIAQTKMEEAVMWAVKHVAR